MTQEEIDAEQEKCKNNPYYFATRYLTINGRPYTTTATEEEFNEYVFRCGMYNGQLSVKEVFKSRKFNKENK